MSPAVLFQFFIVATLACAVKHYWPSQFTLGVPKGLANVLLKTIKSPAQIKRGFFINYLLQV
jgi:hypothetical protein